MNNHSIQLKLSTYPEIRYTPLYPIQKGIKSNKLIISLLSKMWFSFTIHSIIETESHKPDKMVWSQK